METEIDKTIVIFRVDKKDGDKVIKIEEVKQ